ncbi:MAG: N-acyl-D-glutamate deacylase [Planctomycetaceae bacterium]|nr:N-acyl-D-glutamate deacylase [Planctomycetaceae bacterium]
MNDLETTRTFPSLQVGVVLLGCLVAQANAAEPAFDIVLRGGRIVDGTGAPWYVADVGIRGGKIAKIGRIDAAGQTVIDAKGLIVAPGFIDMMGQTASPMVQDPKSGMNLLTQGITTINAGEGASAAPLSQEEGKRQGWTTMAEYFALLEMNGLPVNVVQTVGHTQVRRMVIGEVERRPSPEELKKMQDLVREGMDAGAIGISTALIYPPAVYASTEEIAALAKIAGESGGKYYTHMRNEGDQLLEAIEEALEIGRQGNTPVHIFHLKTAGRQNWGKMPLAIAKIKAARAAGQQVGADIYPYINNGLEISALIHPRHFAEGHEKFRRRLTDDAGLKKEVRAEMENIGGWENWYRHVGQDWDKIVIGQTNDSKYRDVVGQSVAAMAKAKNEDPWETFFNLVKAGSFALPQSMTDANKILAMQQEFVSFCTDVGPAGNDQFVSHPRASGSFPRLFSRYARDLGAISLERAVAQASAVAANEVLAYDRGRISEGLAADICIFDYNKLTDKATFAQPATLSEGMQHVIVNGVLVLHDGKYTGKRPGRVLRGPGFRKEKAAFSVSTGKLDPKLASFDQMMHEFMEQHHVPGATLAVTDQGRLVFARGYGYADLATQEQVQPTSLFRIASVSKPITAVAILKLIEQGKLKLDDKVYEILDYKSDIEQAAADFDVRQRDITIRYLLEHRGGWDRDKSFDAMFESVKFATQRNVPAPAGPQDVIRAMLKQKLDFAPGERYAYSNFGYCLLGRVIEKLSGMTYEAYVKQQVLAPLGIHTMRLGATRLEGRVPGEVRYYQPGAAKSVFQSDLNQEVPWQYGGWHLEAMDSHGGWLASAIDLARFGAAFDDPGHCPILSAASIELMHARPPGLAGHDAAGKPKEVFYSLGWSNRVQNEKTAHWHTGSLSGTATILIRRPDGRNLTVLLNTRVSPTSEHLSRDIDGLVQKTASSITEWPQENHFSEFP